MRTAKFQKFIRIATPRDQTENRSALRKKRVIDSHDTFRGFLENLRKGTYGKSQRLGSEIDSQIRSIESAISMLQRIRLGLVEAL